MKKLTLSKRCEYIVQAEIRTMSIECEKLEGINLAQGVCDTPVPMELQRGVTRAMKMGVNSYTRYDGLQILRRAIARKLKNFNGITADPETQITVSGGSTGAFYCACLALLDPGDEVILFEPYYGYHVNTLDAVEAVPKYVTMRPPNWDFSMKDLEKAITPKTKGIMINTPANPSGKVFTHEELRGIARLANRHNLYVFTDEIYEHFLYEGKKHISPGALPELKNRTITISGFSKTFSITGWRIGYSVAPTAELARMIGYMNDLIYVCGPAPLQYGVAEGLNKLKPAFYKKMAAEYFEKRELICSSLKKAGLNPSVPAGAYYVLADVSRLPGKTGKEKAMYLLRKTGVAGVPGEAFFHNPKDGYNLIRFCYAKDKKDLLAACKRLERL
ncbi:MAG: pyridoxal phosphate-dependent aminotransferase [Elusimicrobia bacterium]|nr:pyridoxal phosphate-dependent aminotransferase [Elusimicrobiota bacterium]